MDPIWAPHVIQDINKSELDLYLEFSGTACIPGGGCNVEEALQVLYQSNGDIKKAMQQLLSSTHQAVWKVDEVHLFERLIMLHGKNFFQISKDLETKTVKQCVQFYYLWKKSPNRNTSPLTTRSTSTTTTVATPISSSSTSEESIESRDSGRDDSLAGTNEEQQQFPCKVCGRVFQKIKSRSAHMKRHKNER